MMELQAETRKVAERPTEARTAPPGAVSIEDAPLIEKMKRRQERRGVLPVVGR